jgi:hypothetical protein
MNPDADLYAYNDKEFYTYSSKSIAKKKNYIYLQDV